MSPQTSPQDSHDPSKGSAGQLFAPPKPSATSNTPQHCSACKSSAQSSDDLPDWYSLRRRHLKSMRRNLLFALFLIGWLTAYERDPICMTAPGRFGCLAESPEQIEQDYGLFYNTSYAISYIVSCACLFIWRTFVTWWVNYPLASPSTTPDHSHAALMVVVRVLVAVTLAFQAIQFLYPLYAILRFGRRAERFSAGFGELRTSWKERSFLVAFAAGAVAIGSHVLYTLEQLEMAKVKTLEYGLVIVPALILVGLRLASKAQWEREQRATFRMVTTKHVEMGV